MAFVFCLVVFALAMLAVFWRNRCIDREAQTLVDEIAGVDELSTPGTIKTTVPCCFSGARSFVGDEFNTVNGRSIK